MCNESYPTIMKFPLDSYVTPKSQVMNPTPNSLSKALGRRPKLDENHKRPENKEKVSRIHHRQKHSEERCPKSKTSRITHQDSTQYDSEDSSLGSLGEVNELNSKFFLQDPNDLGWDVNTRPTHQRLPRKTSSIPDASGSNSQRIRPRGLFLKPRKLRDEV